MRVLGLIACAIFSFLVLAIPLMIYITVTYPYEKSVGAHLENAQEANNPELMLAELNASVIGMRELGLTDDMSSVIFFQKSNNMMKFQYAYLAGVAERIQAVIIWKNKQNETANSESLGDVYNAKMENLRTFLQQDGRADWIAKPANGIAKLGRPIVLLGLPLLFVFAILAFFSFMWSTLE